MLIRQLARREPVLPVRVLFAIKQDVARLRSEAVRCLNSRLYGKAQALLREYDVIAMVAGHNIARAVERSVSLGEQDRDEQAACYFRCAPHGTHIHTY